MMPRYWIEVNKHGYNQNAQFQSVVWDTVNGYTVWASGLRYSIEWVRREAAEWVRKRLADEDGGRADLPAG